MIIYIYIAILQFVCIWLYTYYGIRHFGHLYLLKLSTHTSHFVFDTFDIYATFCVFVIFFSNDFNLNKNRVYIY